MQATVTRITAGGELRVRVRRNHTDETITSRDLKRAGTEAIAFAVGDRIEVARIANDPYLNFVSLVSLGSRSVFLKGCES